MFYFWVCYDVYKIQSKFFFHQKNGFKNILINGIFTVTQTFHWAFLKFIYMTRISSSPILQWSIYISNLYLLNLIRPMKVAEQNYKRKTNRNKAEKETNKRRNQWYILIWLMSNQERQICRCTVPFKKQIWN